MTTHLILSMMTDQGFSRKSGLNSKAISSSGLSGSALSCQPSQSPTPMRSPPRPMSELCECGLLLSVIRRSGMQASGRLGTVEYLLPCEACRSCLTA